MPTPAQLRAPNTQETSARPSPCPCATTVGSLRAANPPELCAPGWGSPGSSAPAQRCPSSPAPAPPDLPTTSWPAGLVRRLSGSFTLTPSGLFRCFSCLELIPPRRSASYMKTSPEATPPAVPPQLSESRSQDGGCHLLAESKRFHIVNLC